MQTASIKRKTDTEIYLKNCRTSTCHSFIIFDDAKLNALCQFVLKDDDCGGYIDPDGRISLEGMFRWIFKQDYGKSPEQAIADTKYTIETNTIKGAVKAGDAIQSIPDPILSGGAFIGGAAALITAPAWAPLATAGAAVAGVSSGLSFAKTGINWYEGKAGIQDVGLELGTKGISAIPLVGKPATIMADGGQFMYDTIKCNYNAGYRFDQNLNFTMPQSDFVGPIRPDGSF